MSIDITGQLPSRAAVDAPEAPRAARAGRALGAGFFAVFGAVWLALWASDRYPGRLAPVCVIVLAAVAWVVAAVRVYRAHAPALRPLRGSPQWRIQARRFGQVNAIQWAAIGLVAALFRANGLDAWVMPAVILIVGLHFLPLAQLYRYPPHYLTGAALVGVAAVFPWAAPLGPADGSAALATGLILWTSAGAALWPSRRDR